MNMDTVWIRLTLINTKYTVNGVEKPLDNKDEHFMFGPTGVVRFHTRNGVTSLLNSASVSIAQVEEDSEFIMKVLCKMRGTEGRLDGKSKQKEKTNQRKKPSTPKKPKN